mgnify:CR=1 FL=1
MRRYLILLIGIILFASCSTPVKFTADYQAKYNGMTTVEIPEVYELVNIVLALTQTGQKDNYIIYKNSDYYKLIWSKFGSYKDEPIVKAIDKLIENNVFYHMELKMDAYSYQIDNDNKIIRKKYFNITSRQKSNTLSKLIPKLQDFACKTNFTVFYKSNLKHYTSQISYFTDSINIDDMQEWLSLNFHNPPYNSFKVVFSPLIDGWQSAITFSNNRFNEVHMHIRYPYYSDSNLSPKSQTLKKGNILFTELNHAYINAERKKYNQRIYKIFDDYSKWLDYSKSSNNYRTPIQCFDEYLNWSLVSLWYIDHAPENDLDKLISLNRNYMVNTRGFLLFKEFDEFLVHAYRNRNENDIIADLFPSIIEWFESNRNIP